MSDLTETDAEAIGTAIRILSEAGYEVEQVNEGTKANGRVSFTLSIKAATAYQHFREQAKIVKKAATDIPDAHMGESESTDQQETLTPEDDQP